MNTRLERVAHTIRDEIADILRREITDPLIGFVTLTDVEVSPDLRHARVFFSVLGDEQQVQDSIKGLLRARKHINALLADRLDLRYIPKLRFVYDETAAKAQRLAALLKDQQQELGPDLERHAAEAPAAAEDEDFDAQFEDDEPDEDDFPDEEDEAAEDDQSP